MTEGKGRYHPEEDEDETYSGPSPAMMIIIALVMLVLISSSIYFLFFKGRSEFEDIEVGNITFVDLDEDGYGEALLIDAYATGGYSEAEGDASLKIFLENETYPIYSTTIEFRNGIGSEKVGRTEFVLRNGVYIVEISKGSKKSERPITITDVVEDISVNWWDGNVDDIMSRTHGHEVRISLKPLGQDGAPLNIGSRSPPFMLNATVTGPGGLSWPVSQPDLDPFIDQTSLAVDHLKRGTYKFSGKWTNSFVNLTSPYRIIEITHNSSYDVDSPPFADAGNDTSVDLIGGSAEVEFSGEMSRDDQGIVEYRWYFGDEEEGGGATISTSYNITHVYNEVGTYYARLVVVDTSGQTSELRWGGFRTIEVLKG